MIYVDLMKVKLLEVVLLYVDTEVYNKNDKLGAYRRGIYKGAE